MVFSSIIFLSIFLPVTFLIHLSLPGIRSKNILLLAASLLFYAYGEPVYLFLLLICTLFNYMAARMITLLEREKDDKAERCVLKGRLCLIIAVIGNVGVLIVFKYAAFLVSSMNVIFAFSIPVPQLRLPIGISFYTFQALSYVIDVYRGQVKAESNFGRVMLYIAFFPQLIAGPIVKYHDIEWELAQREVSREGVYHGIHRFVAGLGKKVLIANTMAQAADHLFVQEIGEIGILSAWIGAVSYFFQIYFDFSGYSDMAIGMGEMFGFHFHENFDYPYISCSIREFWRRWHISLSGWFKEYVYIPLGGNRKGKARTILNRWVVFLLTGFWHGANMTFLLWGIYHGFFLSLEELLPKQKRPGSILRKLFGHIYSVLVIMIGFVLFRAETVQQAFLWVGRMLGAGGSSLMDQSMVLTQLTPLYVVTFILALPGATPVVKHIGKRFYGSILSDVACLVCLILCMLSLAGGSYNPFIYFRF